MTLAVLEANGTKPFARLLGGKLHLNYAIFEEV